MVIWVGGVAVSVKHKHEAFVWEDYETRKKLILLWFLLVGILARKFFSLSYFQTLPVNVNRDVSFPTFAGIPAFTESKFPHIYSLSACFRGF